MAITDTLQKHCRKRGTNAVPKLSIIFLCHECCSTQGGIHWLLTHYCSSHYSSPQSVLEDFCTLNEHTPLLE